MTGEDIQRGMLERLTEHSVLLKRIDDDVKGFRREISKVISSVVPRSEYEDLERRVRRVEDTITWGTRLIVGAVIVALMGLIIAKGGAP